MIITVDFPPNFIIPCMPLGDTKTCAAHYVSQLSLPKSLHPHTMYFRLLKKYINLLDIVNISPYHPPETMTKVSTI